jgi:hypothetical protein
MIIAGAPDLLTPDWLSEALGTAVTGVTAKAVGTGQMSQSARLTLTYDRPGAGPPTVIAKFPAADPTSRGTALQLRSYEIEVRFYQQLAPALPMRTPRALYTDIDVTTGSFILLLEDMAPAQPGDQLAGCSPDEAAVAVLELVGLHAPRWGSRALSELEWLHRDPEASKAGYIMGMPLLWAGFCDRYADRIGSDVRRVGEALFGDLETFLGRDTRPWTVVHGDYRLDNLLFGASEADPIAVVDWQTCAHGPALSDVAYFIGAGLLTDARREHESRLVRDYHAHLLDAGVEGYDWDRCWRDYRRGTVSGLIMAVGASMLVERTERGDDMFMAMAHRHAAHAIDLDAPAIF